MKPKRLYMPGRRYFVILFFSLFALPLAAHLPLSKTPASSQPDSLAWKKSELFTLQGQYQAAIREIRKSLDFRSNLYGKRSAELAAAYEHLGILYLADHSFDKAMESHDSALHIRSTVFGQNSPEVATSYSWLGRVSMAEGDWKEAASYQERALGIRRINEQEGELELAHALKELGDTRLELGNTGRAMELYLEAKPHFTQTFGQSSAKLVETWERMGVCATRTGAFAEAHQYLYQAQEVMNASVGKYGVQSAQIHLSRAEFYRTQSQSDSALFAYQDALRSLIPEYAWASIYTLPDPNYLYSHPLLFEIFWGQCNTFEEQYQVSGSERDRVALIKSYELASQQIDRSRTDLLTHRSDPKRVRMAVTFYEQAVGAHLKLQETDPLMLEKAWAYSEKCRNLQLLQALSGSFPAFFAPDSLLEKERTLRTQKVLLMERWLRDQNDPNFGSKDQEIFQSELTSLNEAYRQLQDLITSTSNQPYPFHLTSPQFSIKTLQKRLPDSRTLVVEYFWGGKQLTGFIASRKKSRTFSIPTDSMFQADLALILQLQGRDSTALSVEQSFKLYEDKGFHLYELLLAPVFEEFPGADRLILIPDGLLHYLAFDALPTERPQHANSYSQLPFLIQQTSLQYAHSTTMLSELQSRPASKAEKSVLAFTPDFPDDIRPAAAWFGQLPEASKTAQFIATLLKGENLRGVRAGKENLKKLAPDYRLLHLATYGTFDDLEPLKGGIYLAPEGDEDGFLQTGELYSLPLNADLTVLESGYRDAKKWNMGEGLSSLVCGLTYAGANAVTLSLWSSDDLSTSQIMKDYYRFLHEGKEKDIALQMAKIAYLEKADEITSNPYFWAALAVNGDPSPIRRRRVYRRWALVGGGILVILMAGLMLGLKKKRKVRYTVLKDY